MQCELLLCNELGLWIYLKATHKLEKLQRESVLRGIQDLVKILKKHCLTFPIFLSGLL